MADRIKISGRIIPIVTMTDDDAADHDALHDDAGSNLSYSYESTLGGFTFASYDSTANADYDLNDFFDGVSAGTGIHFLYLKVISTDTDDPIILNFSTVGIMSLGPGDGIVIKPAGKNAEDIDLERDGCNTYTIRMWIRYG